MSILQTIKSRRSIRRYQSDHIPQETIERVLEAAIWAPSAHNRQPWRFVVLQDDADKHHLAEAMAARLETDLRADGVNEEAIQKDANRSRQRLTGAPVLILICMSMEDMDTYPDDVRQHNEWTMATQSVAMAAQNLLLAAHEEGLGACWMCAPLFCQPTVREALDLPADFEPQGIIAMGYPAQERQRDRAPLESRVIFR